MSLYFASSVQIFADACVELEREQSSKIANLEAELGLARATTELVRSELNEVKRRLAVVQNASMPQVCLEVSKSDDAEAKRLKRNQASNDRRKRDTVKCECGGLTRTKDRRPREYHEASKKHQNWVRDNDQFADPVYE